MSEYQYYEFRAVDRPLTPEQMSEMRALSSRATITPRSFTNTYNYGDFRGDPHKLMETHYDAHVYVSNFGTVTFILRLPRTVIPDSTLARYTTDDGLNWWTTDEHTIIEWRLDEEPSGEWIEEEDWMDQLLPIRDELVQGDYRSLYIGWLSSIEGESMEEEDYEEEEYEEDDDSDDVDADEDDGEDEEEEDVAESVYGTSRREPPVPAGLGSLTEAQVALAEFLGVDSDLIASAAKASPESPVSGASDQGPTEWVARLPEQEVRAIIARIIQGEGLRVQTDLQSRYYRSRNETTESARSGKSGGGRTAAELLALAEQTASERKQHETEERARKRYEHLAGLVPRLSDLWATVDALAQEQKASAYDQIATLLVDMRDAYNQVGRRPEFDTEFARFLGPNSRRTALVRRLKEVRLMS